MLASGCAGVGHARRNVIDSRPNGYLPVVPADFAGVVRRGGPERAAPDVGGSPWELAPMTAIARVALLSSGKIFKSFFRRTMPSCATSTAVCLLLGSLRGIEGSSCG